MNKYIDVDKLIVEIEKRKQIHKSNIEKGFPDEANKITEDDNILSLISSHQQELANTIHWTGDNLKEVIDFTGKSPKFGEWFKSWEEYENYVHSHNDILKLFCEDGSHYEVPVGAWIVKTPDGHNVPSVARFIYAKQEQPSVNLENELIQWHKHHFKKTGTYEKHSGFYLENRSQLDIARHFFELGLNAREK